MKNRTSKINEYQTALTSSILNSLTQIESNTINQKKTPKAKPKSENISIFTSNNVLTA